MFLNKRFNQILASSLLAANLMGVALIQTLTLPRVLRSLNQFPDVCPLHRLLHLKCGFCGMTHAFIHILSGDLGGAFRENLFSPFLFAFYLFTLGSWIAGKPMEISKELRIRAGGIALLLLTFYALIRNLIPV